MINKEEEILELQNKIRKILEENDFIKFTKFFLISDFEKPFIYWIKYSKYGDIHSRSEYLEKSISEQDLIKEIKFPKYQWTIIDRAKTMRKHPDWPHLHYILLEENVDKIINKYPNTGIELKSIKIKGRERFYLNYYIYIMGNIYKKKTKNFKVTENEVDFLDGLLEKNRKYLIK